uniref:Protein FAM91A1 n=2 Tax=Anthurium amnicola TaxID=1678845 RepID=A0A1D1YYA7_9ARAE
MESHSLDSGPTRVALIVDANITSYLMMGSLSPGLKSHAVTLYEAGKLDDATIAELCKDLAALEGKKFEGELQEFANHAFSLRCVLECLQSGGVVDEIPDRPIDDVGAPLSAYSSALVLPGSDAIDESFDSDGNVGELNVKKPLDGINSEKPQGDSFSFDSVAATASLSSDAVFSGDDSLVDTDYKLNHLLQSDQPSGSSDGPNSGKDVLTRRKNYHVNILRCESLAALAPATLDRLFLRDYDIVVSMIPLPSSSVLPGPAGPVHLGPPSYASMTPWMKLVLYTAMASGPLSIVLMKGQCLRMLPVPLAGCEKALIWSWDGSAVGGLGGKYEGNLVSGNILLHCLNSLLRHSAVLVQPLNKHDLGDSGKIVTMDIPLPVKNFDGSIANIGKEMGLCAENSVMLNLLLHELSDKIEAWTVGYIRLLRLYKERESDISVSANEKYEWVPLSMEFGIPLFSPKLCGSICERVVSSHLLQTQSLREHHDAMQRLRKRLRDICLEYQATGPTAKLLYNREHAKESPRQLINYASGRWNPFSEPSTPISESSNEHQRLKLANRQRCRTEVLSFDGNILRSYAFTPVYEAVTRPIEETTGTSSMKPESDDVDNREVVLPGVNLLFDGSQLNLFDIGACLQARQAIFLIAEATTASASLQTNKVS